MSFQFGQSSYIFYFFLATKVLERLIFDCDLFVTLKFKMAAFMRALKSRPLLANCITYGTLYAGAEFSQQTILRKVTVSLRYNYFWTRKICEIGIA